MFSKLFVEEELRDSEQTLKILQKLPNVPLHYIDRVENYFEKVKRPYLQKREDLRLFIGKKKGQLVKEAPLAYGLSGEPHYYFIHAYNCIYECTYCYLQGYFKSPDIVLFINHEEIVTAMKAVLENHPTASKVWFHAGEFSDSLALSHISGELAYYHQFCQENPRAYIELRTKSSNLQALKELKPLSNFIISFSLSPEKEVKEHDLKTATLAQRIKALAKLSERGDPLGLHFDPIIYSEGVEARYQELFDQVFEICKVERLQYISLGVVRFTEKVYREVKRNYPESPLSKQEFKKSFDQKVRYSQSLRLNLLHRLKKHLIDKGVASEKIYFCME